MGLAESYRRNLAAAQVLASKARSDPSRWPFREAAAVLSKFLPAALMPSGPSQADRIGWEDFILDCEPAGGKSGGWWQLRDDLRRETLRRLGTRPRMKEALNANSARPDDELQRALNAVIEGPLPSALSTMSREELSALTRVRDWLGGILDGLPDESQLRRALVVAEILNPLQRLAGGGRFAGRVRELGILREYVGVLVSGSLTSRAWRFVRETYYDLWQRPPLLISGPGGVGKSSLVARLILDHSENLESPDSLPFVYLDLDRAALDPLRPLSLIAEASLQLSIEWPQLERQFGQIIDRIRPTLGAEASAFEGTRALHGQSEVLRDFGKYLDAGSRGRPVLFVIDTFEEAQFLGFDVVQGLGRLLKELQNAAPMLRVVLAGRADLKEQTAVLPTTDVRLGDLSKEDARDLVRRNVTGGTAGSKSTALVNTALVDEIIGLVGRNPLSLKLASKVLSETGIEELKGEARSGLLRRVKAETVQSRLYGRILAHIHDDEVRKVVKPGFLVRRLTDSLIERVLAAPCGLDTSDPAFASRLMVRLASEVALVYRAEDGSLRHQPEVRRVMLKDMVGDIPPTTVRAIHDGAVEFYRAQPLGAVARAEEIYHRLMRGDDPASLDSLWLDAAGQYLRAAIGEVPPAAELWLSNRLGVTPDEGLLKLADLEAWESITARSAQRLLNSGNAAAALVALRQRPDRTGASPLFLLESEAFRLRGDSGSARAAAEQGVASSALVGDLTAQRDLLVQLALIEETAGRPDAALVRMDAALSLPDDSLEDIEKLRLIVTKIRLVRKLGAGRDLERRAAIDRAVALLKPEVQDALNQHPALLREVVAELGKVTPSLFTQALEVLGLDRTEEADTREIARSLADWDRRLTTEGGGPSELARRAGFQGEPDSDAWHGFVAGLAGREFSTNLLNWRQEMQPDPMVDDAVVKFYRSGVDAALSPRSLMLGSLA
jgi:hypothetical protein